MKQVIILLLAFAMMPLTTVAQGKERRWAIEGSIGPTFIKDKTHIDDPFGTKNGTATYVGAEYYIPNTHFSARLGYMNESLYLGKQLVTAEQSTLNLGGRYYPLPEHIFFQPYAGLGANILLSEDNSSTGYAAMSGLTTTYSANIHSPHLAFTPTVGFDLYILSSLALSVNYSYNLGFGNRYDIGYSIDGCDPEMVKGHLNHHNLNIGLKITFPFHFTSRDGVTMLQSILSSIICNRL